MHEVHVAYMCAGRVMPTDVSCQDRALDRETVGMQAMESCMDTHLNVANIPLLTHMIEDSLKGLKVMADGQCTLLQQKCCCSLIHTYT